ncbi:210_t:CDS:2 [Dentiscutata erythropus]|uniref:210_t:CDS:1 n=1 Tax=Dentiscutata erythropus TaxID=1348616 RepID=A0A9N8YWS3_9GLOM|nr:210_t:CDS:2 [Dentiscutata erythropus]
MLLKVATVESQASNIVKATCASAGNPNHTFILRQDCQPYENCIDHVDQQNVSRATCTDSNNIRKWDNKDSDSLTCSENEAFDTDGGKDLILGVTTYAMTNNPMRVYILEAFMSGNSLGRLFNRHNYTKIIKNYDGNSTIKYCFTAGTTQKIIALAAAFG